MNPAFSVIFFTTLSGAGYGLLTWIGLSLAISNFGAGLSRSVAPASQMTTPLFSMLVCALVIGMALTAIGLLSSTFHLGKPLRAWRAFSQWRTSWLSREGVLAVATFAPALALIALLWLAKSDQRYILIAHKCAPTLGIVMALLSLITVACTAMIYASLKPIPAWRHGLVVPIYLVFALSTGLLLAATLLTLPLSNQFAEEYYVFVPRWSLAVPVLLLVALALMKLIYWRAIDRVVMPSRESATALEGTGKVTVFERPHTEANYLTREMGFVLARKHSRKLRIIALLLFAAIPLLAFCAAWLLPSIAVVALWIAAIAAIAGAFVERWLFFAEAKHMVMLYY